LYKAKKSKKKPGAKKAHAAPGKNRGRAKNAPYKSAASAPRKQFTGRIEMTSGGRAFLVPDSGERDLPVRDDLVRGAMHGDRVQAKTLNTRRGGRPMVEVAAILERSIKTLVATYHQGEKEQIWPDERRVQPFSLLREKEALKAEKIIEEETQLLKNAIKQMEISPILSTMNIEAEKIRKQEVEKTLHMLTLDKKEEKIINQLTHSIVDKMMYKTIKNLKKAVENDDTPTINTAKKILIEYEEDTN